MLHKMGMYPLLYYCLFNYYKLFIFSYLVMPLFAQTESFLATQTCGPLSLYEITVTQRDPLKEKQSF